MPAIRPAAIPSCTCCTATAGATTPSPRAWPVFSESGDTLAGAQGFSSAIVVTPNAFTLHKGSMYSSSPTTGDWERFIAEDLVAYIDGHYRTLATRMSRGLAGHSMGGYGALRIGMKRPEVFFSLYIMSACCLTANRNPHPEAMAAAAAIKTREQAEEAARAPGFGPSVNLASAAAWSPNPKNPPLYLDLPVKDGKVRPDIVAKWVANAPLEMLEQYASSLKTYYAIAIDIGTKDTPARVEQAVARGDDAAADPPQLRGVRRRPHQQGARADREERAAVLLEEPRGAGEPDLSTTSELIADPLSTTGPDWKPRMPAPDATLSTQLVWLFVLAAPVACVAWTVTHEELFGEFHDWCLRRSQECRGLYARKFFFLFTCEDCFSHYVAAGAIVITGFRLLVDGWPGALIAWLAVVWVANVYMSLFVRLRLDIKRERVEIDVKKGEESPRQR